MANTINVNQNNNNVSLEDNNRKIIVTDNRAGTTIDVTQPVTSIVTVSSLGPQGPQGPAGEIPSTGSFVLTSSFNLYTGSSDSQFAGTASFAVTASYAANVPLTASYALQALSASYAISASHEIVKEVSSSHADFADTASLAYTASYAVTASYATTLNISGSFTASGLIYPTADGEQGDVLSTDGAGNLSFEKPTVYAKVKNVSGGILPKGLPVHASSSVGNTNEIIPASASDATTMPATFILAQDLNDEEEGLGIVTGFINGVNTSGFEEGQVVYVGANGGYTNVKPTGSNLIQNLGIVTKIDASNGSGFIYGAGRSNDIPNINPGHIWIGNSDWVPTSTPTSSIQNVVSSSYALTASYLDSYVPPFPFVGDAVITGSLAVSGSSSPLLSLPDAPQDAVIISGSSGTTSVYIYDSVDGIRTPTYDKGAGLRLVSGEGTGQATLDVSAVGSDNGGSNNEQTFIRSNQMLSLYGAGNAAGDNIRFRGSFGYVALDSTTAGTSLTFVTNGGSTPSTIALGTIAGSGGVQITTTANQTYLRFIQGANTWLDLTSTKATFLADVSSSAASTASFGTYLGDGSQLTGIDTGSWDGQYSGSAYITGSLQISSSGNQQLTLIGSGSSQPIFRVQGSAGELFSITDSLSGSLFAVNNISGLPILEVFSDDRIIQGDYAAPMLTTTIKNTVSAVGAFTVYELPTSSYDGAFFEYTARSGSNARAGQIMSIWSGSQVNFTETTTTDFGSTTGLAFTMIVTGSNFALTGSVTTADWTIKTIVRSI